MLISVSLATASVARDFQVDIVIQHRHRLARDWFGLDKFLHSSLGGDSKLTVY